MFNEKQIVKVRWNNSNRSWYESRGYIYTKRNDFFDVLAKDIPPRSNTRVKAVCDYCGKEYDTSFVVLMNGRKDIQKDCCCNCTGKKTSEVSLKKRAVKYIDIAKNICNENGYTLLTEIEEYTDLKMNISFICPKHGKQTMLLINFIRGHKCKPCSYEIRADEQKHNAGYVKECIESVNGNKLLNPNDYIGAHVNNLNVKCKCGNVFTVSFANYCYNDINKCYSCSCKISSGEERIKTFLENNKINFIREKRFDDCRDIKPLPFDFYIEKYNLVIEFDGQHHFKDLGRRDFETIKRHDNIKNKYCKDNNIDILRIPYWEGNNIEIIIAEKLNL